MGQAVNTRTASAAKIRRIARRTTTTTTKKHTHDVHHHDDCHHSSGKEETYESLVGPAFSEGEVSASESHDGTPAENYHLENYHIPKKIRTDDVGHKSPKKQTTCGAVVKWTKKKDKKSSSYAKMASSSEPKLNLKDFFPNDASMDSIVRSITQMEEDGLSFHNASDAFDFGN